MTQGYSSERWIKIGLITLVVLNLALMATLWLPHLRRAAPEKKRGIGGREREVAQRFLEDTLSLSPQQKEAAARLRAAHFLKTDVLRKEINDCRRQIMEELFASSPDKEKVERLADELGEKQGDVEKMTFDHFLDLYALCQPDQKEKFRSLMADLVNRLEPPPQEIPRRPRESGPRRAERALEKAADGAAPTPRARSEERPSEASRTGNQIERLRGRLDLSEAQVAKLQPIVERFARQIDELRGRSDDPEALRQAEKSLKDQRDDAIRSLLTHAQSELFEQLKREGRGHEKGAERRRKD